eukprot:CAMPEP_0201541118 /NCGR_PEP_ID=MMETSP0161_2-20130828/71308_1 /ASSEMBLY_ACC=CAM_ASM_000251 /TAXON_ID=180227 /ORGANISM="Neoparamoeba aestuarina, Strain SoJaBio B1-5/56/2" /LENGTH=308 /DNA_ID=CAMNT_0047948631 /DNA_START=30 /DNA_END=953 /DNA_ORIENTATION=+
MLADVIESLVGLIYFHFGLNIAREVCQELSLLTLEPEQEVENGEEMREHQEKEMGEHQEKEMGEDDEGEDGQQGRDRALGEDGDDDEGEYDDGEEVAPGIEIQHLPVYCLPKKVRDSSSWKEREKTAVGYKFKNPKLLLEARTHPSALHPPVPSYQRLEWVGDAVVELVTRTWLFHVFPFLSVHSLSSLKDVVVCNESLAFTCYVHRIHTHADFNDSLLTSQITKYADLVEYKNFDNPLFLEGDKGEKEKEEGEEGEEEDSEGRKENEIKKGRGLYLWSTKEGEEGEEEDSEGRKENEIKKGRGLYLW